jgi:hypothetical protein
VLAWSAIDDGDYGGDDDEDSAGDDESADDDDDEFREFSFQESFLG